MTTTSYTTHITLRRNLQSADMSVNGQQRSRRQREGPIPLPTFTFPCSATSSTQTLPPPTKHTCDFTALPPSHILDLFPTAAPFTEARPRQHHRRNHAVSSSSSTKRYGMLPLPPVPAIPSIYKLDQTSPRLQLSGRSMSEVSSCPTLETDDGLNSPEAFSPSDVRFDDYFTFEPPAVSPDTCVEIADLGIEHAMLIEPTHHDNTIEDLERKNEVEDEEEEEEEEEEDDDDDEEFWHCRGLVDSALSTRKPSLVDMVSDASEDDGAVDVSVWANSVDDDFTTSVWQETRLLPGVEAWSDYEYGLYMGLMLNPLLA